MGSPGWTLPQGLSQLQVRAILGAGRMGSVYLVAQPDEDATKTGFALKRIPRNGRTLGMSPAEAKALKLAANDDPNCRVVHFMGLWACPNYFYLRMTASTGLNLRQLLETMPAGRVNEAEARRVASEIVSGCMHLYEHGVLHGNLEPSNILVDTSGHIKLCGLGFATIFEPGKPVPICQKLGPEDLSPDLCRAPEVFVGPYDPERSDLWSIGAILHKLCFGIAPFLNGQDLLNNIRVDSLKYGGDGYCPADAWDVISICLLGLDKRPGIPHVCGLRYFTNQGVIDDADGEGEAEGDASFSDSESDSDNSGQDSDDDGAFEDVKPRGRKMTGRASSTSTPSATSGSTFNGAARKGVKSTRTARLSSTAGPSAKGRGSKANGTDDSSFGSTSTAGASGSKPRQRKSRQTFDFVDGDETKVPKVPLSADGGESKLPDDWLWEKSPGLWICLKCYPKPGSAIKDRYNADVHFKQQHTENPVSIPCDHCGVTFTRTNDLKRHLQGRTPKDGKARPACPKLKEKLKAEEMRQSKGWGKV